MDKIISLLKSEDTKKLIKFAITGIINTAVDFIIFTVANLLLGFNVYFSQFLGYSTGLINSYILNRSWTFKSKQNFFSHEFIKFITLGISMLILSMGVMYICINIFAFTNLFAKLITTGLILIINFLISKMWVFK